MGVAAGLGGEWWSGLAPAILAVTVVRTLPKDYSRISFSPYNIHDAGSFWAYG